MRSMSDNIYYSSFDKMTTCVSVAQDMQVNRVWENIYQGSRGLSRPYELGHLFERLRMNREMSRSVLAGQFGTTEEYLTQVETGRKIPTLKICLKYSKEFGINPVWVKNKLIKEILRAVEARLSLRLGIKEHG